jgi:hypothetical protein
MPLFTHRLPCPPVLRMPAVRQLCWHGRVQMDQFFFMQDRHDAGYCAVRYIADVRLREWRVYMQSLATRKSAPRARDMQACSMEWLCLRWLSGQQLVRPRQQRGAHTPHHHTHTHRLLVQGP